MVSSGSLPCKKIYFISLPVYGSKGTEKDVSKKKSKKKKKKCFSLSSELSAHRPLLQLKSTEFRGLS